MKLVITLLWCLVLFGCDTVIYPYDIEKVKNVCSEHGGLNRFIKTTIVSDDMLHATCSDGFSQRMNANDN